MSEQKTFKLEAEKRDVRGKKVKTLRQKGLIPAVVYGHEMKPQIISLNLKQFKKIFEEAGTSSLIDLAIADQTAIKVLTHEPQYNPVSDEPIHIDFYKVRMDVKIKTEIPLEFTGESEAVTQLDGSLVTNRDTIEVECLPKDLVSEIKVNITPLKTFEDTITVADLKVPENIEILTDKEEVIALVEPPRSEEELAELEQPTAAEEEKEALEKMEAEAEGEKAEEGEEGKEAAEGETPAQVPPPPPAEKQEENK